MITRASHLVQPLTSYYRLLLTSCFLEIPTSPPAPSPDLTPTLSTWRGSKRGANPLTNSFFVFFIISYLIACSLPTTYSLLIPHSCLGFEYPHIILPLNIILSTHYITFPINGKRHHILTGITGKITALVPFIYSRIVFHYIL